MKTPGPEANLINGKRQFENIQLMKVIGHANEPGAKFPSRLEN
jgi:hypothetical protein